MENYSPSHPTDDYDDIKPQENSMKINDKYQYLSSDSRSKNLSSGNVIGKQNLEIDDEEFSVWNQEQCGNQSQLSDKINKFSSFRRSRSKSIGKWSPSIDTKSRSRSKDRNRRSHSKSNSRRSTSRSRARRSRSKSYTGIITRNESNVIETIKSHLKSPILKSHSNYSDSRPNEPMNLISSSEFKSFDSGDEKSNISSKLTELRGSTQCDSPKEKWGCDSDDEQIVQTNNSKPIENSFPINESYRNDGFNERNESTFGGRRHQDFGDRRGRGRQEFGDRRGRVDFGNRRDFGDRRGRDSFNYGRGRQDFGDRRGRGTFRGFQVDNRWNKSREQDDNELDTRVKPWEQSRQESVQRSEDRENSGWGKVNKNDDDSEEEFGAWGKRDTNDQGSRKAPTTSPVDQPKSGRNQCGSNDNVNKSWTSNNNSARENTEGGFVAWKNAQRAVASKTTEKFVPNNQSDEEINSNWGAEKTKRKVFGDSDDEDSEFGAWGNEKKVNKAAETNVESNEANNRFAPKNDHFVPDYNQSQWSASPYFIDPALVPPPPPPPSIDRSSHNLLETLMTKAGLSSDSLRLAVSDTSGRSSNHDSLSTILKTAANTVISRLVESSQQKQRQQRHRASHDNMSMSPPSPPPPPPPPPTSQQYNHGSQAFVPPPLPIYGDLLKPSSLGAGGIATAVTDAMSKEIVVDETKRQRADFDTKVEWQERVAVEVKRHLKPAYMSRTIDKGDYKDIMRRCVTKITRSGVTEINGDKIEKFVQSYVAKYNKGKRGRQHSAVTSSEVV